MLKNDLCLRSFLSLQKLSAQLVKRYLAKRSLSEKRTDADSGMLQAIESSKTELRQTLKEIIKFIELRKKKENK